MLSEGPTDGINDSVDAASKKFSINFRKQNFKQNFAWVYVTMAIITICLLIEKESIISYPIIKISTFQLNFV